MNGQWSAFGNISSYHMCPLPPIQSVSGASAQWETAEMAAAAGSSSSHTPRPLTLKSSGRHFHCHPKFGITREQTGVTREQMGSKELVLCPAPQGWHPSLPDPLPPAPPACCSHASWALTVSTQASAVPEGVVGAKLSKGKQLPHSHTKR